MANEIQIVRKGESLSFTFDRGGDSIEGWTCTINVKIYPDDTSLITRTIEPDETKQEWNGYLASTETESLDVATYRLIGVLTESDTNEEEQIPIRFRITSAWAD